MVAVLSVFRAGHPGGAGVARPGGGAMRSIRRTIRRSIVAAAVTLGALGSAAFHVPPAAASAAPGNPHWLVSGDGTVWSVNGAPNYGSMGGQKLSAPIVGMTPTPSRHGYWLLAGDGGLFAFGDAGYFGSMGGHALNKPIVGMAPTSTGKGYW